MDISIVTDSTADIPADLIENYHIQVIPNLIMIDGASLRDGTGYLAPGILRPPALARPAAHHRHRLHPAPIPKPTSGYSARAPAISSRSTLPPN